MIYRTYIIYVCNIYTIYECLVCIKRFVANRRERHNVE